MKLPKEKKTIRFRGKVVLTDENDTKRFFEHVKEIAQIDDTFAFWFEGEIHVEGVLNDHHDEEELWKGFNFETAEFEFTDGKWRFWRRKYMKNEDTWYGDAGSVVYNNDTVYALFAYDVLDSIHANEEEASRWCEFCNASLDRNFNILPVEFHD